MEVNRWVIGTLTKFSQTEGLSRQRFFLHFALYFKAYWQHLHGWVLLGTYLRASPSACPVTLALEVGDDG